MHAKYNHPVRSCDSQFTSNMFDAGIGKSLKLKSLKSTIKLIWVCLQLFYKCLCIDLFQLGTGRVINIGGKM